MENLSNKIDNLIWWAHQMMKRAEKIMNAITLDENGKIIDSEPNRARVEKLTVTMEERAEALWLLNARHGLNLNKILTEEDRVEKLLLRMESAGILETKAVI